MENKDIDITTGLPRLPEGQVWEVRKKMAIVAYDFARFWDGKYEICIVETNASTVEEWVWKGIIPTVVSRSVDKVIFVRTITYKDDSAVYDLTPEVVLYNAQILMSKAERQYTSKSFLGVYPPNRLEQ